MNQFCDTISKLCTISLKPQDVQGSKVTQGRQCIHLSPVPVCLFLSLSVCGILQSVSANGQFFPVWQYVFLSKKFIISIRLYIQYYDSSGSCEIYEVSLIVQLRTSDQENQNITKCYVTHVMCSTPLTVFSRTIVT